MVANFVNSRVINGKQQITVAIDFHTYAELILWPMGYTTTDVPADMTQDDLKRSHVFFPYYPAGYGVEAFLQLHVAYSKVIRQVAAKEDVALVDLEVPLGGPARRPLFWDTMHPSLAGHRLIAETLAETVRRVRAPGSKA